MKFYAHNHFSIIALLLGRWKNFTETLLVFWLRKIWYVRYEVHIHWCNVLLRERGMIIGGIFALCCWNCASLKDQTLNSYWVPKAGKKSIIASHGKSLRMKIICQSKKSRFQITCYHWASRKKDQREIEIKFEWES